MSRIAAASLIVIALTTGSVYADVCTSVVGGEFTHSLNWTCSHVPGPSDDVFVHHLMNLTSPVTVKTLALVPPSAEGPGGGIQGTVGTLEVLEYFNWGYLNVGAAVKIAAGATMSVSGSHQLNGTLDNAGLVEVNGGTLEVYGRYSGPGRVTAGSGAAIRYRGAGSTYNNPVFEGAGAHIVMGPNTTFSGTIRVLTGTSLVVGITDVAATWNAATLEGIMSWQGGDVNGELTIAPTGVLSVDGSGIYRTWWAGGRIHNYGRVSILTEFQVADTFVFDNETSGVVDFKGNYNFNFVTTFNNAGLVIKSGGSDSGRLFAGSINNTGTISAAAGYLHLNGPLTHVSGGLIAMPGTVLAYQRPSTFANGTLFSGGGYHEINGAATFNGSITVDSGMTIRVSDAAWNNATLNGRLQWFGGTMSGNLTGAAGSVIDVVRNDFSSHVWSGGRVDNYGTWNVRTFLNADGGLVFDNKGTGVLDIKGDYHINALASLINAGTLVKSASGGGSSQITGVIQNTGTIDVTDGMLSCMSGLNHSAGKLRLGLGISRHAQLSVNGAMNFAGTLEAYSVGGFVPVIGQGFTVLLFGSSSGAFTSRNLTVGGFTLVDSYTPTTLTLVTAANATPIATDDAYSVNEDETLTVAATGVLSNDSYASAFVALLVGSPASGSVLLQSNGAFEYTPNANFNGTDSFTYKLSDGTQASNIATVRITVVAAADAPVASIDTYEVNEDTTLTVASPGVLGNDVDADGDALTAILVTQPSSGTVNMNADGSFTYEPMPNTFGTDHFLYKASDGTLQSTVKTVVIHVWSVEDAPLAASDSFATNEDTTLTVAARGVLRNDVDPDGAVPALQAIKLSDPAHGTVTLNADGSFSYQPQSDFNGADSFTYKATDGMLDSNPAVVTISVAAANDAPTSRNDSYATAEDTSLHVPAPGVLTNDEDVEGSTLTAVLASAPTKGTLNLRTDGSFTYTPNANANGSDSFTYRATDGTATSPVATVTISISPANDEPVPVSQTLTTNEHTPLRITLQATDTDGDPLTYTVTSGPSKGTLSGTAPTLTYAAAAGSTGSDSFTFAVSDGIASVAATVTINIQPLPALTISNASGSESDPFANFTAQLSAPSQFPVTFEFVTNPLTATEGTDYSRHAGQVTFLPGVTTRTFGVPLIADDVVEGDETFELRLSNAQNARLGTTTAIGTIVDDDVAPVSVQFATAAQRSTGEGDTLQVKVTLSAPSTQPVNVSIVVDATSTATSSSDYNLTPGSVTFAPGQLEATFQVALVNDTVDEDDETLVLRLSSAAPLGTPAMHTITITDDEFPTVRFALATDIRLTERAMSSTLTVTLSRASATAITVPFSWTATPGKEPIEGRDFTIAASPLIIPAGSASANIVVQLLDDNIREAVEEMTISLQSSTGATVANPSSRLFVITDNDPEPTATFTIAGQRTAGESGTVTVDVQLSAVSDVSFTVPILLTGTATKNVDYRMSESLIVPPGVMSRAFVITLIDDTVDEEDETIVLLIGSTQHIVTITDDDVPSVQFEAPTRATFEDSTRVAINVTLSSASDTAISLPFVVTQPTDVRAATAGTDFTVAVSPLIIPAGARSASINVTALRDNVHEPTEGFRIELQPAAGVTLGSPASHLVYITDLNPRPIASFTTPSQITAAESGQVTIAVRLSSASEDALEFPLNVGASGSTATRNIDYRVDASSVVFPPGATNAQVVLTVLSDTLDEPDESVVFIVGTSMHTVIIKDDDEPSADIAIVAGGVQPLGPYRINQAVTYRFEVANNGPSAVQRARAQIQRPVQPGEGDHAGNSSAIRRRWVPSTVVTDKGTCVVAVDDTATIETITCDIGALGSGATASIAVESFAFQNTGSVPDIIKAVVSSEIADPVRQNNEVTQLQMTGSGGFAPASITVTDDHDPSAVGSLITYAIDVRTPAGASGALQITFGSNADLISYPAACEPATGGLRCSRSWNEFTTERFEIVLRPSAAAFITVNAALERTTAAETTAVITSTAASADVGATGSVMPDGPYSINQPVTYRFNVVNAGPDRAPGVLAVMRRTLQPGEGKHAALNPQAAVVRGYVPSVVTATNGTCEIAFIEAKSGSFEDIRCRFASLDALASTPIIVESYAFQQIRNESPGTIQIVVGSQIPDAHLNTNTLSMNQVSGNGQFAPASIELSDTPDPAVVNQDLTLTARVRTPGGATGQFSFTWAANAPRVMSVPSGCSVTGTRVVCDVSNATWPEYGDQRFSIIVRPAVAGVLTTEAALGNVRAQQNTAVNAR